MTTCKIEFENNPNKVLYAGQTLRGTVELALTEAKTVRGIYIQIHGKGFCKWRSGKATHSGKENYLNETTYFIGGNDVNVQVDPGTYKYNFQCILPAELPTSVEGKLGHIRYTARVVIDFSFWINKEFKQRFTVIKAVDLNNDPTLRCPVIAVQNSSSCFSTPLEFIATLPVTGYTPGQVINLEIHVENQNRKKNYEFAVKLVKRIDYFETSQLDCCGKATKSECREITQLKIPVCPGNSDEIIYVNLPVPPTPPTDESPSKIIKVTYFVRISASVGLCCHPALHIPIIIGSYRIRDTPQDANASTAIEPSELNINNQSPTSEETVDLQAQLI